MGNKNANRTEDATAHNAEQNKTFPIGTIQTVKTIFEELYLPPVLDDLKHCGHSLSNLVIGIVSDTLTYDLPVINCHKWMNNNPLLLQELHLEPFGKYALYRGLNTIGENRHLILHHLLFTLKNEFDVGLDMVFMNWTSTHLEAQPADFIKYGYSRDHRPGRLQVTIGINQDQRSQMPVGLTIQPGNMNDQTHFKHTYHQIKPGL